MKKAILEALTILVISLTLALAVNGLRSKGIRLVRSPAPQPAAENSAGTGAEMAFSRAVEKFNTGQAVFIDARSAADYQAGHIPGALNLSPHRFDEWMDEFFTRTDPDRELIAYCHGEDCPLAKNLAQLLLEAGFENVSYLADGWGQWEVQGLPVETGAPE